MAFFGAEPLLHVLKPPRKVGRWGGWLHVRKAFVYYVTLLCLKVLKQLYTLESL